MIKSNINPKHEHSKRISELFENIIAEIERAERCNDSVRIEVLGVYFKGIHKIVDKLYGE